MNPGHILLTVQESLKEVAGKEPVAGKQPPAGVQLSCQIKRVIPGEVHFLAGEPVPSGARAEAEFDEQCRVSGQIVGCLRSGDQYLLSFRCDNSERRQEQRFPVNQPGWLLPSLAPNSPQVAVLLCDVSRHGVGLDVPDALALKSAVVLKTLECFIFGTIQYCIPHEFGFKAGMHIDEIFFRGHKLDPQASELVHAGLSIHSKRIH